MNRELGRALDRAMTCHYIRRHCVATEFIAVAVDLDALRIDRPLLAGPAESQLGHQALNWVADSNNTLPRLPDDFSLEGGEDPNIVTAHDTQEAEYRRIYASSGFVRLRIRLRDMPEPLDPTTQKLVLAAIGVLGGLLVWRLGGRPAHG